ncbi:nitroreductase family protein, partial [Staphylococcus pasteuri_A]
IQNMWLAARAENLGLGWVSIIHDQVLRDTLAIPERLEIIGYLCLGHVSSFSEKPELEQFGWLPREQLDQLVHNEKWTDKS